MREQPTGVTGLARAQRRVRRLVPAPVRRADLALFRVVARARVPVLGPALRPLSRSANHSRLWMAVALGLSLGAGRFGRRAGLRGMLAVGVTSAVTNLPAKFAAGRARPDLDLVPLARRLARIPTSTSFPSGHSASAFAFATGASLELPALRAPLVALAAAVAGSRVYTGVHYPGDVLAGAAIGAAVARRTVRMWPTADLRPAQAAEGPRLDLAADGSDVAVVANSGAGNALGRKPAHALHDALPGARLVEAAEGEDLATVLRRAAREARVLAVAGGDGSASCGAAVAADLGIPLAVVPAGTLNHLAKDLGVEGVEESIAALRHGRVIRVDHAEIDGRPFINAASIGTYPYLVLHRERLESRLGKWPALILALLRLLTTHRPIDVEIDGERRRVWLLFIGNCRFTADGVAPSRRARLDDGVLDVRLVHAERPWARVRLFASMVSGRLGRCAVFERWLADEVRIRSLDGPLQIAADGETWEGSADVTVRKRREQVHVLQPPSHEESP